MALPYSEREEQREIRLHPKQERTLSSRQKAMVRARDRNCCQYPYPHVCEGPLQVHHIKPFGELTRAKGQPASVADGLDNLITLCDEIHMGGRQNPLWMVIHQDTVEARRRYGQGNKQAYQEMYQAREQRMKQGLPYHNTRYDAVMQRVAHENTRRAIQEGTFSYRAFEKARKGNRGRRTKAT